MAETIIKCPKCGHGNPASAKDCENCGITFEIYRKERERAKVLKEEPKGPETVEETEQADNLTGCPNCGHPTDLSSEDCLKCGIVFSKYYKIQESALADDPAKLEALRKQKEEHDKAVALRRKREEEERAERLRKQQIEREKAEALKKQKAARAKAEKLKKDQAEREKQEALKKRQAELERQQAAMLQQAEQEKQKAMDAQKAEHEKASAALKEQVEKEKQEALKKQQAQFEQQQAANRRLAEQEKQAAIDKQKEADSKAIAAIKEQAEKELEAALEKQKEDLEKNKHLEQVKSVLKKFPPQAGIRDLLKKYEGQTVGINHQDPATLVSAVLVRVGEDHFSVLTLDNGLLYSYPFTAIASTVEGTAGIPVGEGDTERTVFFALKIFHPGT